MAVSAVRMYEISTKFNFDFASIYYFYFFISPESVELPSFHFKSLQIYLFL